MEDLQQALHDVSLHLKGTDNEVKVVSLEKLNHAIQGAESSEDTANTLSKALETFKSSLKTNNTRVSLAALACITSLFSWLHTAISAVEEGHHVSGYSTLLHDVTGALVPAQGSGLMAFLGDSKENIRLQAGKALLLAGQAAALDSSRSTATSQESALGIIDKAVKEQGLTSKNARIREQSLLYVAALRAEHSTLPLRPWVPLLVDLLEDSDATVRDTARESLVSIFTAPSISPAARTDLKREILKKGVRRTTSDAILKRILANSATGVPVSNASRASQSRASGIDGNRESDTTLASFPAATPRPGSRLSRTPVTAQVSTQSSISASAKSVNSSTKPAAKGERLLKAPKEMSNEDILAQIDAQAASAAAAAPETEVNVVQVVYIASAKDLDSEIQAMLPHFQGKETEHNWQSREKSIFKLRGLVQGNAAASEYRAEFVGALKSMQEGILKAASSLRTTLSSAACHLIAELANTLQHSLDPLYDTFLSHLVKMSSLNKKTIVQLSQESVSTLITNCSFHIKTINLLASNLDNKNVQVRQYAMVHLKQIIEVHAAQHKHQIESTGNLDAINQTLRKGLGDANAPVRDTARFTFWIVDKIWPSLSRSIIDSLDGNARKLLEKAGSATNGAPVSGARSVSNTSAASNASRTSMRDLIQSRRAAASAVTTATNGAAGSQQTPSKSSSATSPPSTLRRAAGSVAQPSAATPPSYARPASSTSPSKTSPSAVRSASSARQAASVTRERSLSGGSSTGRMTVTSRSSPLRTVVTPASASLSQLKQSQSTSQTASRASVSNPRPSLLQEPPSPTLHAMAHNGDTSNMEGFTLDIANTVPLPNETSSDDESLDLLANQSKDRTPIRARNPVLNRSGEKSFNGMADTSHLLDHLMDDSMLSEFTIAPVEADEAVRSRAEQAEQTAHRFLEVTEPDDGDTTIVHHDLQDEAGIGSHSPESVPVNQQTFDTLTGVTPLVKRIQHTHLQDSPAQRNDRGSSAAVIEDSWWLTKANALTAKAEPIEAITPLPAELLTIIEDLEKQTISPLHLIRIARFSADNACEDSDNAVQISLWQEDRLFTRLFDGLMKLLERQEANENTEPSLILLKNLVTYQNSLLGGREIEVFRLLFDLRKRPNKGTAAAAKVVMQLFLGQMEPLYGLSSLRTSLEALLKPGLENSVKLDSPTAEAYAMGIQGLGSTFSKLESEVLEEELSRVKDLLQTALNNQDYPYLRQAATSALVQAHRVLQDETRLFDILGGLTKSQIHLCTYLFAKDASAR